MSDMLTDTNDTNETNIEIFSDEERQAIYDDINSIAVKNKDELSSAASGSLVVEAAKKRGVLLPVLVNAAALLLLAAGAFLFFYFSGREKAQLLRGPLQYDSAEQALIQQIRRETNAKLEAKESEIQSMVSKLGDINSQLDALHSNNRELSTEQLAAEADLKKLRGEYQSNLDNLRGERVQILEDSRAKEAALKAQLDTVSAKSAQDLDAARTELDKLSAEQNRVTAAAAQLGGLYKNIGEAIAQGKFDDAAAAISRAREFLNTPAFQGNRTFAAQKDTQLATLASFDALLTEQKKLSAANAAAAAPAQAEPAPEQAASSAPANSVEIAEYEKAVNELNTLRKENQDLTAQLTSGNADTKAITDKLTKQVAVMQADADAKDNTIKALQTKDAANTQQIAQKDGSIADLQKQVADQKNQITQLNNQLTAIRQLLQSGNNNTPAPAAEVPAGGD